jgi:hypothetical protein
MVMMCPPDEILNSFSFCDSSGAAKGPFRIDVNIQAPKGNLRYKDS